MEVSCIGMEGAVFDSLFLCLWVPMFFRFVKPNSFRFVLLKTLVDTRCIHSFFNFMLC